jgi:NUMOD4 motif/HNH endonuclease
VTAAPERWLPVPGYEDSYEVSNHGQVWSRPRTTTRGGLLKLIPDRHGYLHVTLTQNGKQKHFPVHRLVMLAFAGAPEPGQEVRHLDGNPANNRWEPGTEEESKAAGGNLAYGTHARNMADMAEHGTCLVTARETHCPKGHEYTPENTRSRQRGGFACKQCIRDYQRDYQKEYRLRRLADPAYRERLNAAQRRNYQKRKLRRGEPDAA